MARFVQLPSGTVFAQKPLQFSTPLQGSNLTTKDVVDILNVAEAVGKSESIGALASKAKENIGAAYEGVKGLFGGEEKKPAEQKPAAPPAEGEQKPAQPPVNFNAPAQAAPKPADVEQKVDNTKVAPPVNTEGTGAVLPPPKTEDKKDVTAPQAPPVKPIIPPPPSVVVAPPTKAAEKPAEKPAPVAPLVQPIVKEATAPTQTSGPKQETEQERLQRYLNNRVEIGVNPPQINPDGSVNLQDQQRFFREVLAKGDAEEAALAKPPVASGAMPPAAPVAAAPTVDQAAAARVAAAKPAEQPKVEVKLGEPIAGNRFYDLRKEPDKVATEIAAMAAQGFKARSIEQYIKEYQKFGTTELDYYNMIGALKAAKESLPADSTERTKLNVEENQLREKVKKALEDKGLKYDEGKVPKLTPAKTTSQGDAFYEQAVAKFMDNQPLTDAEKFALAGGPANEKAPQPSAAPKAKKTVGATGVETKELKQAAIPGPRPEVEVPPATGGGAGAGTVPKGAVAKGAVVRASGAAVPPVEAAKPGVAQPGFKVDAKTVEQAGAAAAGAAGEKAAEQVARTEAQPQADFRQKFDDLLKKFPTKETKPVPATADIVNRDLLAKGDPDAILLAVQKKLAEEEQAATLKIPENVSYQQLLSYARKATTPANQALVLEAFQRATGKPPPKTLVEMYNGDNETRAIAMLEAAFPAKAQEADAYTKQLKYAQAYKAVADSIKQVQAAQTDQAREAGLTQRAYRTEVEIASGDVSANLANKLAQAESRLEGAGLSAEKARETAELVELRKAAMAANTAAKIAEFDNKYNYKIALMRAGGGGGKKGEKIKPELEWKIKDSTYKDSIDEQRKIVANLQNQATRRKVIPTQIAQLESLRQQAYDKGPAFAPNVSAYDTKIAELKGELDGLPTDAELKNQLALEVGALKELETRKAGLTDEFLGRKPAVAPAETSVPLTKDSKGGPQSAGQKGQTGKGPTTKGKGQ